MTRISWRGQRSVSGRRCSIRPPRLHSLAMPRGPWRERRVFQFDTRTSGSDKAIHRCAAPRVKGSGAASLFLGQGLGRSGRLSSVCVSRRPGFWPGGGTAAPCSRAARQPPSVLRRRREGSGRHGRTGAVSTAAFWLILPVVICLPQRLSHARASTIPWNGKTADGSLDQLWFLRTYILNWITLAILELIHASKLRPRGTSAVIRPKPPGQPGS